MVLRLLSRTLQDLFVVTARTRWKLCEIPNSSLQKEERVAYARVFEIEGFGFKKGEPRMTLSVAARHDYLSNQSGLCTSNLNKLKSLPCSHPSAEQNIKIKIVSTSLPQIPLPKVK